MTPAGWEALRHAVAATRLWRDLLPGPLPRAWEEVPVTCRAIVQGRLADSLADPRLAGEAPGEARDGHQVFRSAGRGGDLGVFVYDRAMWEAYLADVRARLELAEPGLSTASVALVGTSDPAHTLVRLAAAFAPGQATVVGLQDGYPACARRLDELRPEVLYGFSSALVLLAGRLRIRPRQVLCGTDALTADGRRLIREAWGCEAFDSYASTEGGMMAVECRTHAGLHIDDGRVLLEPRPDGVLLTNLVNRAQPFIRYRLADAVEEVAGGCPCGRAGRRLRLAEGRAVGVWTMPGTAGEDVPVHPIVLRSALDGARASWSDGVLDVRLDRPLDADEARERTIAALRRAAVDVDRVRVRVTAA